MLREFSWVSYNNRACHFGVDSTIYLESARLISDKSDRLRFKVSQILSVNVELVHVYVLNEMYLR